MGAKIVKEERTLPYSLRYEIEYNKKDLLDFSQKLKVFLELKYFLWGSL